MAKTHDMSCKELAELVTEYLEGNLPPAQRTQFDRHLVACAGCQAYLEQMRQVVRTLGRFKEEPIPDGTKEKLLEAFRNWTLAEEKTVARNIRLGIKDENVAPGDHIAYFWETLEEFEEAVGFLEVGLRANEYCVVFGHEQANETVLAFLRKRSLDVERLMERGRLRVLGGDPSSEGMLANIAADFQVAIAGGAPLIRLLGNIGWGRPNWPNENDILAFEAKVTAAARQFPSVIVCMYDVCSLPGRIILKGGFETHPLTVRDQVLRDNPHYVPVEEFLTRLRGETSPGRIQ